MSNRHRIPRVREHVGDGTSDWKRPDLKHRWWTGLFGLWLIAHLSVASAPAAENGSDPADIPDGVSTYTFVPERSFLQIAGGLAGVYESCPVEGYFKLSVDLRERTALFLEVDANVVSHNRWVHVESLGELLNITRVRGYVVGQGEIGFRETDLDERYRGIALALVFTREGVRLAGTLSEFQGPDSVYFGIEALAEYDLGTGEPNNAFRVYTAEQMDAIGADPNRWDKHFHLMADLDLSGCGDDRFHRIGLPQKPFHGVFDGNGHTISNFCLPKVPYWDEYVGLFGYIAGPQAEVRNLVLIDPNVGHRKYQYSDSRYVGALAGELHEGLISNCCVRGGAITGGDCTGGLVGVNRGRIQDSCFRDGIVTGADGAGGLVGVNRGTIQDSCFRGTLYGGVGAGGLVGCNAGSLLRCYATSIISAGISAGGLVGSTEADAPETARPQGRTKMKSLSDGTGSTVAYCYATGYVRGGAGVAGLVGSNGGTIRRCYSTCYVSTNSNTRGGLVWSDNPASVIEACFWDVQASGMAESAGGEGKTTAEMKTAGTFLLAGWDFTGETANGTEDVWQILEGQDYPRLRWEHGGCP